MPVCHNVQCGNNEEDMQRYRLHGLDDDKFVVLQIYRSELMQEFGNLRNVLSSCHGLSSRQKIILKLLLTGISLACYYDSG